MTSDHQNNTIQEVDGASTKSDDVIGPILGLLLLSGLIGGGIYFKNKKGQS